MKKAVWWSLTSLVLFLLVESAIFRSGWYMRYLEPDSTAGFLEYRYYWLRHAAPATRPEVMVVGDSRIGESFFAKKADAAVQGRLQFWNMGVSGAGPRDWFYLLRDADPDRRRFAAIVLALDRYSDEDSYDDLRDRMEDLHYLIGRLRLTDCWDFSMSMNRPDNRHNALLGCVLKGVALRRDAKEFLRNISARRHAARYARETGLHDIDQYDGRPEDLTGLSVDYGHRPVADGVIHFPAGLTEQQMASVRATATPDWAPDPGVTTGYRNLWLGRVLELYRASATQVVFVQMPRGPVGRPEDPVPPRFLKSVAARKGVAVTPEERYKDLEQPALFADGLHLNSRGGSLFSTRLGRDIEALLGGH